jgi:hypothetical protein
MPTRSQVPGQSLRRVWRMNPVTRVHDNDIRKNRKKERQQIKKRLAVELRDNRRPFDYRLNQYEVA